MKFKKALSLFMTAVLLSSSMPLKVFAQENVDEKDYAKSIVKNGETMYFGSKNSFKAHDVKFGGIDWSVALGTCSGYMVARVQNNKGKYTVDYLLYTYDFYDWERDLTAGFSIMENYHLWDADLYKLHAAGLAKEYYVQGIYEKKGVVYH